MILGAVLWWLAPGLVYRAAMAFERRAAGLELRTVTVQSRRWMLLEGGRPGGESLLLLHGFGADKDNWLRIARPLVEQFHITIPDLPGFGDSEPPADGDYAIEAQAARVGALLDALQLKTVTIAGSSMGGYIALALARQRPQQVKSLWLLAPGGLSAVPLSEMMEVIAAGGQNPLIPAGAAEFEQTLDFVFERRPFIPAPVRRYLAARQAAQRTHYEAIFADLRYRSPPAEELAAGLTQPALIIWGSEDRVLHPQGAEALAAIMPRAQSVIFPAIGHLPMIEAPELTAREFLSWYRQEVGGDSAD